MEKVNLYIQKLIALLLSLFIFFALSDRFEIRISAPIAFLVLSFLHFKITGEKPKYLYGLTKADDYLNKKGGFWLLFKWVFGIFGFIYDLLVWTINGVYALFLILMDILLLVKSIVFWIIHAVLWFLQLFVPPIIFLYKIFIYYLIRWPWWIYKLTFRNASIAINRNFFFISLWGSVIAIFLVSLFFGVGVLVGIPVVFFIGVVFALLPLVWSYAEISALRKENRTNDDYSSIRMNFDKGFEAVKAILFYLVIFLVAFLSEIIMDILGWIPNVGFSLLGISLNVNTFFSLVLVFVFIILAFSKFLMPAHIVHNPDYENDIEGGMRFLGVIGKKFLRYLLAHIPGSVFAAFLSIIPIVVVGLAITLTLELKNSVLDARITGLMAKQYMVESKETSIDIQTRIDRLNYYKGFPQNIFYDFTNLKSYSESKTLLENNVEALKDELLKVENIYLQDIDSLENRVMGLRNSSTESNFPVLARAERSLDSRKSSYNDWKSNNEEKLYKMQADIKDAKGMLWQLPVSFFFVIIWISIFGGLILAIVISYLGNVYHELYGFREDSKPTYFRKVVLELNKKDRNQPLLGFTLIILIGLISWFYLSGLISEWIIFLG